jgi:ADP-glucose pyrophosphorylase
MRYALICFPSQEKQKFLSFTEKKSKFELGIGGRFRIIDFPLSLAQHVDVRQIILYQNSSEGNLQNFLQNYLSNKELMRLHLLQKGIHNFLQDTYSILKTGKIDAIIMYNGDNPALFDIGWMAQKFSEMNKPKALFLLKKTFHKELENDRTNFKILFAKRDIFLSTLKKIMNENLNTPNIFERIINESVVKSMPQIQTQGFFSTVSNISEYYKFNMKILHSQWEADQVFKKLKVGSFLVKKGSSTLSRESIIYNSIISENCQIKGTVIDSIIFPGVHIGKETEVVSSVILPNNRIGDYAKIFHSILEEAEDRNVKDFGLNIGDYCLIGKMNDKMVGYNSNYPELLKDGLTVIGRNCSIPRKVKIGANCYISPETNKLKIKMYNRVVDGASL